MTREITHMKAFAAALESMEKPAFSIGRIAPTETLVNQYFNDSTGTGDHGEIDARGPWNEAPDLQYVEAPAFQDIRGTLPDGPGIYAESSEFGDFEPLQELLQDQLRDILHAEKQLLKALPKMAKAARSARLQGLFATHLEETQMQVDRLDESLKLLGAPTRAKPCKGMMGLVEEGQEVIEESKDKDDAFADLALIGAAQRVEHYEISGYTTARNLAQQLHNSAVVQLLTMSLGEEENADQLLNQVAQSLMSVARMPVSVE
jgi:Mn-containing catalase